VFERHVSLAWWQIPTIIPVHESLRQEDYELEASLEGLQGKKLLRESQRRENERDRETVREKKIYKSNHCLINFLMYDSIYMTVFYCCYV
jgi:hypothetical protein